MAEACDGAQAFDELKTDYLAATKGSQWIGQTLMHETEGGQTQGGTRLKSDVLRLDRTSCFVQSKAGKDGGLRIDGTTPMRGHTSLGYRITLSDFERKSQ